LTVKRTDRLIVQITKQNFGTVFWNIENFLFL